MNTILSIDWTEDIFKTDFKVEEVKYTDFDADPFPSVCQLYDKNRDGSSIFDYITTNDLSKIVVSVDYIEKAETIKSYFKNKILLRRLKGEHVSEWMKEVEILLENPLKVKTKSIRILVTLPRFYKENLILDELTSNHTSLEVGNIYTLENSYTCEFVTKVHRNSNQSNHYDFYWKTKDNNLVRVRCKPNEYSYSAWEFLSTLKKIKITGIFGHSKIQGYNFSVIIPAHHNTIELA